MHVACSETVKHEPAVLLEVGVSIRHALFSQPLSVKHGPQQMPHERAGGKQIRHAWVIGVERDNVAQCVSKLDRDCATVRDEPPSRAGERLRE